MDRKWKSGAVGAPPAAAENASDGYPTAGNPGVTPPTKPGPYWFHMITEELLAIIAAAGIAFDKAVLTQLLSAFRRLRGATSRVLGADCTNNAVTPNTQFDLSAREIQLRDPATGDIVVVRNPATKTVNIATAGPVANGRDQAGAFANNSWVHFYWIGKVDGTFDAIASASAENVGPVLPAAYTHWAYAGAVRLGGAGALVKTRIKGAFAFYEAGQQVLATGTAIVETAVSLASQIPPNALSVGLLVQAVLTVSADAGEEVHMRVISGSSLNWLRVDVSGAIQICNSDSREYPNVGQNIYYLWANVYGPGNIVSRNVNINCYGYRVPNGGE